jgi:hypothetical protein
MSLVANIRTNPGVPFPALVKGGGPIGIQKQIGIWTVTMNFGALAVVSVVPNPASTYQLVWDQSTNTYYTLLLGASSAASQKTIVGAGPYAAQPSDQVLIIQQTAPFTVNVDWSTRAGRPLRVVDGQGNAPTWPISITPAAGQTQMGQVDYTYVIDGAGGSILLTPLSNLSGAF